MIGGTVYGQSQTRAQGCFSSPFRPSHQSRPIVSLCGITLTGSGVVFLCMWIRPLAYLSMTVLERQHFVYGSLMNKQVLTTLLGRVPVLVPGTLHGYHRYRVPEEVYPGILPSEPSDSINGLLVKGLTESEVAVFDAFELEYIKAEVEISIGEGDGASKEQAWVYVWKVDPKRPLVEEWNYEETFLPHLENYLKQSREFREWVAEEYGIPIDWEDGQPKTF